ncbi:MAG TPA: ExeM/NucH family extracellular endonuclease, partial [Marmoricola sp.]|nr:ExeM/NucH family extracellular endonuclease [Marmoricola sp.]
MQFAPRACLSARGPAKAAVAAAAPLAMLASLLAVAPPASAVAPDSSVFINELHYDNAGTDTGEFIEVAGPAGTDLTGWSVVLYNGGNNAQYDSDSLSGMLGDDTGTGFGFASISYPTDGIQNGPADGVALLDDSGRVVQFLSYEGVLTTAAGQSTDIGVAEGSATAAGLSLQLTGTGDSYGDFTWASPATQTLNAANNQQLFVASGDPVPPTVDCEPSVEATTGEGATSPVSATDQDSGIASLAITSAAVDGITLDGSTAPTGVGEAATATLTVAGTTEVGTYQVEITATSDDDAQAVCTVAVTVSEPLETTLVSTVQGSGAASPLDGQEVQVEAVVTSLITDNDVLNGFYVQEEDGDADGDPATSEGVYVFCGSTCPEGLAAGDLVEVVGTVDEFFENTQINATSGSVSVLASGLPRPTAATVTLPASSSTEDPGTFEKVEGMITTIPTTLAVSEYFNLARFGEIVLTANEREYQYTQTNAPTVQGYEAFLADLATRRIILDDDSNDENDATSGPLDNEPYYYPTPGLSTDNYFRGGDTITGLTGVMEYSFGAWKLRPVPGEDYTFEPANPRPATPDDVGGRLQVASFNVLNYFATIDTTSSDDTGPCAPSGTEDCRGADSEEERQRQLAKIVAALKTIDADVFGLIEIQNDAGLATQQIVDALNAATADGTYDYIDTGAIGTDAIKQAFLYKTATVRPVGDFDLLTEEDDARFDDERNRPALIQTFEEIATG